MPPAFASSSCDRHLGRFYVFVVVNKLPWAWVHRHLSSILSPLDMYLEVRSFENKLVLFLIGVGGHFLISFNNNCTYLYSHKKYARVHLPYLFQNGLSFLPAGILTVVRRGIRGMLFAFPRWLVTLNTFHFPHVLCLLLKMFILILPVFTLDRLLSYWFESLTHFHC